LKQGEDRRRKAALRPKHVWSIRTKLQVEGRMRDPALFNVAIDSKLRGCDVVALKVDDLAPGGATVRQKKTGRPVKFELTESTRQAIRRLPAGYRQEVRRIPVHRPAGE
jgi:integrase